MTRAATISVRALALLAALAAGCAAAALGPAAPATARRALRAEIAGKRIWVAPVEDPHDLLDAREENALRAEIALGLLAIAERPRGRERERDRSRDFAVAGARAEADFVLAVEIEEFRDPDPLLALLAGFGTGRPGYAATIRIDPAERVRIARTSGRFTAAARGPRAAMLRSIAAAAVRIVRRRA